MAMYSRVTELKHDNRGLRHLVSKRTLQSTSSLWPQQFSYGGKKGGAGYRHLGWPSGWGEWGTPASPSTPHLAAPHFSWVLGEVLLSAERGPDKLACASRKGETLSLIHISFILRMRKLIL